MTLNKILFVFYLMFVTAMLIACKKTGIQDNTLAQKNSNRVFIEQIDSTNKELDRYTSDNHIYRGNRKYTFDYYILKANDTFKIAIPKYKDLALDKAWSYILHSEKNMDKIENISILVLPNSDFQQTQIRFNYHYNVDPVPTQFQSTSGLVENEINIWLHPPRDKYFRILELNPFPYIKKPYKIKNSWTWQLEIGDYWQDSRWKSWQGPVTNLYKYRISGKKK